MSDLRQKTKTFFNALDWNKPVTFGDLKLIKDSVPSTLYVKNLHGAAGGNDRVSDLAFQIELQESAGSYLFTGNRGTGKTTELLRLAGLLKQSGCEVFYADMGEYIDLTSPLEPTDFLITLMGALSEKVAERLEIDPAKQNWWERIWQFLQTEVQITEVSLGVKDGASLKAALALDPTFKRLLQEKTRGYLSRIVELARAYALEIVNLVRTERRDEGRKIVLIADSVERLGGSSVGEEIHKVFSSAAILFDNHADKLRFTGLNVVYTVPPFLAAVSEGGLSTYAGGQIYALPSVHIYEGCPVPGQPCQPSEHGLAVMRAIVEKRYPGWAEFFNKEQLDQLALSSGGDLRDYFRMLRLCLVRAGQGQFPVTDSAVRDAENAVRADMLPLADDDREWLRKITRSHACNLPSLEKLPDLARLIHGKRVLNYRNGEDLYDVHPLIRKEVGGGEDEKGGGA